MVRRNIYISEDDYKYLESLGSSISEHVRFALAQYIHKLRQEETRLAQNASASASLKGGDNGRTTNS